MKLYTTALLAATTASISAYYEHSAVIIEMEV